MIYFNAVLIGESKAVPAFQNLNARIDNHPNTVHTGNFQLFTSCSCFPVLRTPGSGGNGAEKSQYYVIFELTTDLTMFLEISGENTVLF